LRRAIEPSDTRGAIASVIVHGGIALLVLHASAPPKAAQPPIDIELLDAPAPPPRDLDLGVAAVANASTRNVAPTARVPSAAPIVEKTGTFAIAPNDHSIPDTTNTPGESVNAAQLCAGNDCVLEDLNRCLAGDGEGCVGVGAYYEQRRDDPFSAIKWYVKGCGLASHAACDANERVKNARPAGWTHRPFYGPPPDALHSSEDG
jgi:hypothetical protein